MATQASPKMTTEALGTVHQYIDAFNKGDVKAMAACFASPASILDGMPPHLWQGPRATEDWYRDVLITTKKEGATDFFISSGEPLHTDITADAAYVVVPRRCRSNCMASTSHNLERYSRWHFAELQTSGESQRGRGQKELASDTARERELFKRSGA